MTAVACPVRILFHCPRIPNNTGATMRLAAVTGAELHLARPLGFDMDDAKLRRAGVDYRDQAATFVHDSLEDAFAALLPARVFAFTAHADAGPLRRRLRARRRPAVRPGADRAWTPPCWPTPGSPSASGSRCARNAFAQPRQRRRHRRLRGLAPARIPRRRRPLTHVLRRARQCAAASAMVEI